MRKVSRLIACVLCAMLAGPALGDDACRVPNDFGLADHDRARLGNLDMSRTRGLGDALRSDNAADRAVVASLFNGGLAPIDPSLLRGRYKCRTIKLGKALPLVVYQWFRCEIGQEDATFTVRKITGSQNFFGILEPAGAGYAYRGAGFYGYEDMRFYDDDPERNQVGCLSAVAQGKRHFVLELPSPRVESYHDVIEFLPQ